MRRWLVPGAFALVAVATARSAVAAAAAAAVHGDARHWLVLLYFLLRTGVALAFAIFTVGRAEPHRRSRRPLALAACATAVATVAGFSPPRAATATALVLAGDLLAVVACVWLLYAVLTLGRCFGVLPEARGLVTNGPYRLVRHPVYLGELGACAGLVLAAPAPGNAVLFALLGAAQAIRMQLEEQALTSAFPGYRDYAAATPRLIPVPLLALAARWIRPRPGAADMQPDASL